MHESELCAFAPLRETLFQSRRFRDTHKVKLVKKRSKTNGVELGSSLLVPPSAQVLKCLLLAERLDMSRTPTLYAPKFRPHLNVEWFFTYP